MSKETKIVSGFPGVGKTHFQAESHKRGITVLDSDSSAFSWLEPGVRHPEFPQNYIEHIKAQMGTADVILVSSHGVVREALVANEIPFTLVFPDIALKDEYLARYAARGDNEKFVAMMDENWERFICELGAQGRCQQIELHRGEYLSTFL